jgi:hypothetical protein
MESPGSRLLLHKSSNDLDGLRKLGQMDRIPAKTLGNVDFCQSAFEIHPISLEVALHMPESLFHHHDHWRYADENRHSSNNHSIAISRSSEESSWHVICTPSAPLQSRHIFASPDLAPKNETSGEQMENNSVSIRHTCDPISFDLLQDLSIP